MRMTFRGLNENNLLQIGDTSGQLVEGGTSRYLKIVEGQTLYPVIYNKETDF